MTFVPTAERLIPDLTPRQELTLLARTLWAEGYTDHLAGHLTLNLNDGTLLCNPWMITWDELCPSQVIRIDLDGNVLEGDWPAPLGIPLHLALHRLRPGISWAMHNHPLFGTVWADLGEIPPVMDQSSGATGSKVVLVDEYEGGVNDMTTAERVVKRIEDAEVALLRGHGVFIVGPSARTIFHRAIGLEKRCEHAWYLRAMTPKLHSPVPESWMEFKTAHGEGPRGYWEPSIRRILRAEPDLLDR
jgi:L-ribulose-5-phosphate 4-epimerase